MAEDFTTYTEKDDNNRATVTTSRITVASMPSTEDVYIYKDKTANFYDGDFTFAVTIKLTAADADGHQYVWMVANLIDDTKGIDDASGDFLAAFFYSFGGIYYIAIRECDGGSVVSDFYICSLNTVYYLTITRDESVGTYGTLYCYIYSDADRTNLLDTPTLTLRTSKKDFRYLYGLNNRNSGTSGRTISGYSENLGSYTESDPGYAATYPTNSLLRTSGIRRTFWAGLGGQSVYQCELALGGMSTTYVSPISTRDIPSAVTPSPNLKETYERWLDYYITYNLAGLIKTFGHIPTYEEWTNWIKQGQAPYFPKYF